MLRSDSDRQVADADGLGLFGVQEPQPTVSCVVPSPLLQGEGAVNADTLMFVNAGSQGSAADVATAKANSSNMRAYISGDVKEVFSYLGPGSNPNSGQQAIQGQHSIKHAGSQGSLGVEGLQPTGGSVPTLKGSEAQQQGLFSQGSDHQPVRFLCLDCTYFEAPQSVRSARRTPCIPSLLERFAARRRSPEYLQYMTELDDSFTVADPPLAVDPPNVSVVFLVPGTARAEQANHFDMY